MILHVLRGLFILLIAAVGYAYLSLSWVTMALAVGLGILFVSIDILSPRKKLAVFSGTLLGLIVGIAIAYALHFAVALIIDQLSLLGIGPRMAEERRALVQFVTMVIGLISCYLSISFTLQTKDDFRFILPYVEFSKKVKGERPLLVDTSALIDGRIADVIETGFIQSQLVVPRFVLQELQTIADSGDKLKRNRGRRGLDVLAKLRHDSRAQLVLYELSGPEEQAEGGVDQRLVELARGLGGRILTTDYNLNKVATLRGIDVINLNDLSRSLKPSVLPGEKMRVRLIKPGESSGQGVGYLDDGTMVVVEQGRSHLNESVEVQVTSALQTSAGKMIFGRLNTEARQEEEQAAIPSSGGDGRR